ncbi:Guanine nucleotide-binding protein alpha-3 subunit [Venturia nashicola]|nr:Guanine nucleotide-binding protein alpha-3 subunit [Venturia nashicola]
MKLSYTLLVSILACSVSADKHRLCCCAGWNACGTFACLGPATQQVVTDSANRYIRSGKSWDKNSGAPVPGINNWMYAAEQGDDGFLGGDEVSGICEQQELSSRCFTPKWGTGDYRNGVKIKGRQVHEVSKRKAPPRSGSGGRAKSKPGSTGSASDGRSSHGFRKNTKDEDATHWPVCEEE